ncbi:MAG: hypothetical protein Q8L87_20955 [Anaerolineales bacterium]|nr:hypothetical protein [Anaerolineales bacterium]
MNHLRNGHFHAKIYPSGVILEKALGFSLPAPECEKRGQITGFSDKAARRLRECFLTLKVDGYSFWSFTLTTHEIYTPKEWRDITKRFRNAVKRSKWAGLWRVELQRRKTPHLHVAFWLPVGTGVDEVKSLWLKATREHNDAEAIKHAVQGRQIEQDDSGWAVYMALHDGKKKEAQLGWVGKQWGIWNESLFTEREPSTFDLNPREHAAFLRVLAKLDRSKKEAQKRAAYIPSGWVDVETIAVTTKTGQPVERLRITPREVGAPMGGLWWEAPKWKRPELPKMHRGNLLRCVSGAEVLRIIEGIKSGRICSRLNGPERSECLRAHLKAS